MKIATYTIGLWAALAGILAAPGCRRPVEPFYISDLASLRRLPEEDLLRMRDDILAKAAALPDQKVEENLPRANLLASGKLTGIRERPATGAVRLLERPNGKRLLCVVNFRVPRAPDLRVEIGGTAGKFQDLGPLLGNVGRQCFALPTGMNESRLERVRIRSVIFDEIFAEATLGGAR